MESHLLTGVKAVICVKAVCTSDKKGQPKREVDCVEIKTNFGIVGDAHADAKTHRQVSLLDVGKIEIMRKKGYDAQHGDFGENIVTENLPTDDLAVGSTLKIGTAKLQISQIGKACHSPCAIERITGECIMPVDGLFAVVLADGRVTAGDEIKITKHVKRSTIQAAVVTVSDRCSVGETADTSGPAIAQILTESLNVNIAWQGIVPDERETIAETLSQLSEPERYIDLIFTTGGTGFGRRDITPEATTSIIDRPASGIAEAIRYASLAITPNAMLSRAVAGIRNNTLIINLPGSAKAVKESLEVVVPVLTHAVELLRGEPVDCGGQVV